MTLNDGFDRTVADWLDDQAGRGAPGYLDEILTRTTHTRQRPWWSSPERWLPMQSTARFAQAPRMIWLLVVLALILALGATVLVVGSRRPVPSPFGQGSTGTVLYGAADGDIYALDTATNQSRPLIVGPTIDSDPSFSPDGTRFVFSRHEAGGVTTMMVANADGSDVRLLTGKMQGFAQLAWSPAGDQLAYAGQIDGTFGLFTIGLDGTTHLVVPRQPGPAFGTLEDPHWRSDGHELVFLFGHLDMVPQIGVYAVQADGKGLRAIVEPTAPAPTQLSLSPDGTNAVYSTSSSGPARLHVVDLDTGDDRLIDFDGTLGGLRPSWSPDGSKLLFERQSGGTYHLAVGSVDGGPAIEIGPAQPSNTGGSQAQFSPDGTKVLAFYHSDGTSWILDPADGSAIQLGDEITSPLTWQSTAP
jgi:Tol biopolymer transport system component